MLNVGNFWLNMLKQLMYVFLLNIFMTCFVIADETPIVVLKNRLAKINNLYVHFVQKTNKVNSNIIEECQGEMWIKRPHFFYWHMTFPEENFVISDGISLWFYIPMIKQITVYPVKNISDNVFLMLFFKDNDLLWNNCNVYQKGNYFFLEFIHSHVDVKECRIMITDCGIIKQYSIVEFNGEYTEYHLSKHNNSEINITRFSLNVPHGVQLDDQR